MSPDSRSHGPLNAHIVVRRSETFTLDIELEIEPGTTLALLGPNGAGKSTTVDVLAGSIALDAGRIVLDGVPHDDPATKTFVQSEDRGLGIVFQDYLLFDHLSVRENVAFGPRCSRRSAEVVDEVTSSWMQALDIEAFADRSPSELSGGQAQRVALARALAVEPRLLLLDEPLAALDVETRSRLRRTLVGHLERFNGPRLLITHDPTDAFLLADEIAILEAGRITQRGTPDELRRTPATPYAAALAGLNLFAGTNQGGTLELDDFTQVLSTADTQSSGPVLITIRPNAVALHGEQPSGSPRNSWPSTVRSIESMGDITRVTLDLPLPLSVDITPGAASSLALAPGVAVWASIKATEIFVDQTDGLGTVAIQHRAGE